MGHYIQSIVGKKESISKICSDWILAKQIDLPQGFSIIPVTDELIEDIDELSGKEATFPFDEFEKLNSNLISLLKSYNSQLAYIETEYWGGTGCQSAVIIDGNLNSIKPLKTESEWDNLKDKHLHTPIGVWAINSVLKTLGIKITNQQDEFDEIRLGLFRSNEDLLKKSL